MQLDAQACLKRLSGTRNSGTWRPVLRLFAIRRKAQESPVHFYTGFTQLHISTRRFVKLLKTITMSVVFTIFCATLTGCKMHQENAWLWRGPNPSMKKLDELKAMGIKTIISVRNNPSEKKEAYAEKIGMNWMTVKTSVMKSPKEEDIQRFLTMVSDPANRPIYVCCVGGRDRSVFYVTAYKIAVEGADPKEAVAHMDGSTWHKLWPGFRYYVDILLSGAKDKYGWRPGMMTTQAAQAPSEKSVPAHRESDRADSDDDEDDDQDEDVK